MISAGREKSLTQLRGSESFASTLAPDKVRAFSGDMKLSCLILLLGLASAGPGHAGDFLGWDANGNPIVSLPDGNGGKVIPDGNGGYSPLIPVEGGYLHRNEQGGYDFKPAVPIN